ncbi:MAG: DUF262 domain-containing protein [Prevotella sp.]|nr:DUF262 domain-containing protein [Prevotella sp.]
MPFLRFSVLSWKPKQVRDLIDSLYEGYPTGYLIISQSPNIKLKDGSISVGKKIMIDGQQRVTALMTAIVGMDIINSDFQKKRIKISFNPLANPENDEERFKVQDKAILNDKRWIADIAECFSTSFNTYTFVTEYCKINNEIDPSTLSNTLVRLLDIKNRQIGVITLDKDLTIDEVTEIFIRINSQGAKLNQADFAMSKIAANTSYGGNMLRKAIDYFSHLSSQRDWYADMTKDTEFASSKYAPKLAWLKDEQKQIFDMDYNDILRISFMYKFGRAKMKDLVSLLGGRDFETREYREEIAENSFASLSEGVLDFMNEYNFTNFVLAIKSAGFTSNKLINSKLTLDFAYTLYLLLHADSNIDKTHIKHYVMKWYVMTTLTSRYITSPETVMDMDIRRIKERGFLRYFNEVEAANLSPTFWEVTLVQYLETSVVNSPYFNLYLASQIHASDDALFTRGSKIADLLTLIGDVHHIFPKKYLINNGIKDKAKYNQIANFTYLDTQVNKAVGDDSPNVYFTKIFDQCKTGTIIYGNITDKEELLRNLAQNCIPEAVLHMEYSDYGRFLDERRKLMATKIKNYYYSL